MLSGNITEKNLQKAHPDDFEKIMDLPGQSLAEKYFIYINGAIKEHRTEHGGFKCWDAGAFVS